MNEWPQSGKARLTAIINAAGDVVHIEDVVTTLTVSRQKASQLLSRWAKQGWLRRVGPGAYVPVQLELRDAEQVVQDPWVLVPALFDPAYVGGRTAAAHWDLTEQVFRDVLVFTARPLRRKTVESQGAVFTLRHINKELIFGTRTVWRGQSRVDVSDMHRTIVDMLDDPATGGGIQHVADCFGQYMQHKDGDPQLLIEYADCLGNGAVFKRLGFLAERHPKGEVLADSARSRLTQGYAKLDPGLECQRLVTRWRLRIPETWTEKAQR